MANDGVVKANDGSGPLTMGCTTLNDAALTMANDSVVEANDGSA